jgi:hypothetical protein
LEASRNVAALAPRQLKYASLTEWGENAAFLSANTLNQKGEN